MRIRFVLALVSLSVVGLALAQDDDLGNLSANPFDPNSTANPYGAGNPYSPNSINNPYGTYGSEYSPNSVNNPYATDTPKLYDSEGNYRGKLSSNPYDPESISNPYGKYGNPYSSESINNPYGAGNPYASDSPTNPYGTGWKIVPPGSENTEDDDNSWQSPSLDTPSTYGADELFKSYDYGTDNVYKPYDYGTDSMDTWGNDTNSGYENVWDNN